jgi:ketosteroid isomerase-like protein
MSVGRWTAVVLVMSLLVACSSARRAEARAEAVAALRASLLEADHAWSAAAAASDTPLDVFEALMVDDVHVLPPDAPMVRGREESRAVFAELYGMPGFSLSWSPAEAIVDDEGTLGVTIGTYRMALQDADGLPVTVAGKYMTVWVRRPDGSWGVTADMFNADGPPPPAAE